MKTQFDVLLKILQELIVRKQLAILDGLRTFDEYQYLLGELHGLEEAKREVLDIMQKHEEYEDD